VPDNVRSAVRRLGIRYPVALDNDFATWRAYDNRYWPAKYLIDASGVVRFHHFGEGAYDETESWIRRLLGQRHRGATAPSEDDRALREPTTPESYLGYARLDRFANRHVLPDADWRYTFPPEPLPPDHLAYAGRWVVEGERIVAGPQARLRLRFRAAAIFLVLEGEGRVGVTVDGRPFEPVDVGGTPRLREIARFPRVRTGLLELRFSPGVAAYAFTFG
jgi:hypothetical protein